VVLTARVVLVTVPDPEGAETLVRQLVEEGVVACGSIVPGITSLYRWQGRVERESETLVVFKTTATGAEKLVARVPQLHPYDVPEVLVLPVEGGHGPYMKWISESVGE
jgi:periplasmic divalent cation tolerance protein